MRKWFWMVGVLLAGGSVVRAEEMSAAAPSVEVLSAALGTGVDNRELQGEATSFDAAVTRVYCWTKAKAASTPGAIKHVWSVDGKSVSEVPLTLSVSPARTWSYKTVWPGAWKVEIQDDAGAVLKTLEFSVGAAEAAPRPPSNTSFRVQKPPVRHPPDRGFFFPLSSENTALTSPRR